MNPKRGPLNEPNSPEEVPKTDRFIVEDKTQDRHIQEAFDEAGMEHLAKVSGLDQDQLLEMHKLIMINKMFTKLGF